MTHPDRFDDYERSCGAELEGTVEKEVTYQNGETRTQEMSNRCDNTLTFDEHYAGLRHMDGYEGRVHVLRCDECRAERVVCPVCTTAEGGPGWYRGESTGKMLACDCCNAKEAARQRRAPY